MQPFTSHTGVAAPLLKDDVNTDQIAPILQFAQPEGRLQGDCCSCARAGATTAAKIRISCSTSRSSATPASW